MSAMPARTPTLTPIPRKSATMRKLALVKPILRPIVSPIAQAIPVGVPQGRASKRTFVFIILGMIIAGMMTLLYVNTLAAQASFQKYELQIQLSKMTAQEQAIASTVLLGESPGMLLESAKTMGMVPAQTPVFLRLSDREILGTPVVAAPQVVP
ncbi:MAG: hypothetical protein NWS06_02655 [Candidatus Nanopelagicales bacterium]|jgi:hypothetical protein|nr:hypothetical protein [Candidatus Nanopelagicales bacterium]MDP4666901.1 hypothetical protein [Candidatus Nanopelagicales bacterium]MDP4895745.1 hypothetical protein [Candidatus Nanopelagicales bacterium]MDP5050249.1 hypothetical protein [Candidatus Nanopelagicales bacterium]